jgi:hypothetical protein
MTPVNVQTTPIHRHVPVKIIHNGDVTPRDIRKNTAAATIVDNPNVISATCHL